MKYEIENTTEKIRLIAEPMVEAIGCELLNLNLGYAKNTIRLSLTIDKEGGINIASCIKISKLLRRQLTEELFTDGVFKIEVSSPGVDTPLIDEGDFRRKKSKEISLWHNQDGYPSPIDGTIVESKDNTLILNSYGEEIEFSIDMIEKGKLKVKI